MEKGECCRVMGRIHALTDLIIQNQGELMLVIRNYSDYCRKVGFGTQRISQDYIRGSIGTISGYLKSSEDGILLPIQRKHNLDLFPNYYDLGLDGSDKIYVSDKELGHSSGKSAYMGDGKLPLTDEFFTGVDFRIGRNDVRAYFRDLGLLEEYEVLEKKF